MQLSDIITLSTMWLQMSIPIIGAAWAAIKK